MMKRDAFWAPEPPYFPSIFAVTTIAETCATIVRTRSGSPHDQSGIQDKATRSPFAWRNHYRAASSAADREDWRESPGYQKITATPDSSCHLAPNCGVTTL